MEKGSDLSKKEAIKRRAKRKTITQIMMLYLISIALKKRRARIRKILRDTSYCQQNIIKADDMLYGKYFKIDFALCDVPIAKLK